jgi:prepilin-type N-terminal cleavage/methylation domain-containing protein
MTNTSLLPPSLYIPRTAPRVPALHRGYTLIELMLTIGIVLLLVGSIGGAGCVRRGSSHEDGWSVGTLINVRMEGALWERPAATLLHTGEMKGEDFALDDGLLDQARELADQSARVRVHAVHRYMCWAWNYARCEIITAIALDPAYQYENTINRNGVLTGSGATGN